jgi:UDP-glucose:glycoprotein glucosyltransferase
LGVDETNFFKIALAVHEAAPRIESYNQYYSESVIASLSNYDDQCEVWVQTGDHQICDYQKFLDTLKHIDFDNSKPIDILPFDHVIYPSSSTKNKKAVVLYTTQFSSKFAEFHNYLSKAVEEHNITYIIRYRPSTSAVAPGSPLYLSGYGVEMALKRTDYLVIDDRTSQGNMTSTRTYDDLF